jgi:DNA mismatch repair protein MutL
VDVNVHPTKNEVRFARQRDIHEAVRQAAAQTLFETDKSSWDTRKAFKNEEFTRQGRVSETGTREFGLRPGGAVGAYAPEGSRNAEGGKEKFEFGLRPGGAIGASAPEGIRNGEFGKKKKEFGRWNSEGGIRKADDRFQPESLDTDEYAKRGIPDERATRDAQPESRLSQTTIWQKKRFGDMRIIGQLHNTYIVCEADAGLILIDQHAAHERILFERFSDRATHSPKAAQRLLVPESVELGYREAGVLEKLIPDLAELGLDIEPFGGNTFLIKSVPPLLAEREVKPLLVEIVEKIVEIGSSSGLAEMLDECRMVMACHGAIRANQTLSAAQINGLLTQLDECHNPSHCPHGRPTWIRWDIRSLEKSFKRIV